MRHAKSDWSARQADFDRPLNRRGELAAQRMAEWLDDQDLIPDRVLSSSALRTRTTAMAVVRHCHVDLAKVDFDDELYLASAVVWRDVAVACTDERVLLCGHNPGLDELVDYLASGHAPLSASGKLMTTAAIAHFRLRGSWTSLSPETCELVSLTRPREIDDD